MKVQPEASVLLLLTACSGAPADDTGAVLAPADLLVELATVVSTDLYRGVHHAVGADDLNAMADGETLSGRLVLPGDADPSAWDVDATGAAEWSVTHVVDATFEGLRTWTWATALTLDRLVLPSVVVAADAGWAPELEVYDCQIARGGWDGTVTTEGGATYAVRFDTVGTWGTLNAVEGTIDGEAVSWENDEPDVP